MTGIINYGMGNLLSVYKAFCYLGEKTVICDYPEELKEVDRIVIPGVGAFKDCVENLSEKGFIEALNESVLLQGKPVLGICLGMQAMADKSYEGGEHKGLGWFDAVVVRIGSDNFALRVPHIGWNDIDYRKDSPLFVKIPANPDFYFVHSYYMKCNDKQDVDATFVYGGIFTAAVRKNNIFAVQFHPEKSQDYGLQVLDNFLKWRP